MTRSDRRHPLTATNREIVTANQYAGLANNKAARRSIRAENKLRLQERSLVNRLIVAAARRTNKTIADSAISKMEGEAVVVKIDQLL